MVAVVSHAEFTARTSTTRGHVQTLRESHRLQAMPQKIGNQPVFALGQLGVRAMGRKEGLAVPPWRALCQPLAHRAWTLQGPAISRSVQPLLKDTKPEGGAIRANHGLLHAFLL